MESKNLDLSAFIIGWPGASPLQQFLHQDIAASVTGRSAAPHGPAVSHTLCSHSMTTSRGPAWHKGTAKGRGPGTGGQTCFLWLSQLYQACQTQLCQTQRCCQHCSSTALLPREERHGALGVIKAHLPLTLHQLQFWEEETYHTAALFYFNYSYTSFFHIVPGSMDHWYRLKVTLQRGKYPLHTPLSRPSRKSPYEFSPFVLQSWTGITQSITSIT